MSDAPKGMTSGGGVVRVWRGVTSQGRDQVAYEAHLVEHVFPALRALPGFRGVRVLRRHVDSGVEYLVSTTWASMEAVRAFAGDDPGRAVIEPEARALLLEADDAVHHYEISHDLP